MIVADINLVASLLLGGVEAPAARLVFERDSSWSAPLLWRSEFRSILAAYMRLRNFPLAAAWQAYELAELLIGSDEYAVGGHRILQLVSASRCSAYDCEYVALAEELDVPLITSDRQILRQFPSIAINPKNFGR